MINELTAKRARDAIMALAQEVREVFDNHDKSHVYMNITVTGRTRDELKLTFSMSDTVYGSGGVTAGRAERALEELMRRGDWEKVNEAILLPKPCDVVEAPSADTNDERYTPL